MCNKIGEITNVQSYGANCAQADDDTSNGNCLFLNIQTPYRTRTCRRNNLKLVLFTIHGGAYTGGNGGVGFDAGNLVSRQDAAAVSITVIAESTSAGSVKALLGSPPETPTRPSRSFESGVMPMSVHAS